VKKLMLIGLLLAAAACAPLTPQQQNEKGEELYGQGRELLLALGADSQAFYDRSLYDQRRTPLASVRGEKREVLRRALALLRAAEKYGNAKAALELAFIYAQDDDVLGLEPEPRLAQYRHYLEKAEAADIILARELLATNYLWGINGYKRDLGKGLELLEAAAAAGSEGARRFLLRFYQDHLKQYPEKYIYWREQNAEQGDGAAQADLGDKFQKGYYPFPQSYEKAKYWYERAAANNSDLGFHYLGHLYLLGQGVEPDYLKARELFAQAAALEDWGGAAHHLGEIYYNGLGVKRNYREAFEWFRRGAEGGYYGSMYMTAYMYYRGRGVKASGGEAKTWYDLAREAEYDDGYAESQYLKPAITYLRRIFK
jgi:TPR repeat protein